MAEVNEPAIQSITFHEGTVEIVYADPKDIENLRELGILRTRVILSPINLCEDEFRDLQEAAIELLDKILVIERNPTPPAFRR